MLNTTANSNHTYVQIGFCFFGQVVRLQYKGARKRLPIQGRITPTAKNCSFKQKGIEPSPAGYTGQAAVKKVIDQVAINIYFRFGGCAPSYKEPAGFAHLLGAGQGFEGPGNIAFGAGSG